MKKHVLTISPGYVKHWEVPRALAEIALNGVEREAEESESKFDYFRKVSDGLIILSFRNAKSELSLKDLCLGNSTKRDHFGEGLKLAILTLVRAEKEVKIAFNNILWTFFIEYNEVFDSDLLTFSETVRKTNSSDLIIQVKGITNDEYNKYGTFFLDEQPINYSENEYGKITREFNSCYISQMNTQMKTFFGYSLNADSLDKNRERTIVKNHETVFPSLIVKYFSDRAKLDVDWFDELDEYLNPKRTYDDSSWWMQTQVVDRLEELGLFKGKAYEKYMNKTIESDVYYTNDYTEKRQAEALGIEYRSINDRFKKIFKHFGKLNLFRGKKLDLSNEGVYDTIVKKYELTEEDKGLLKRALTY